MEAILAKLAEHGPIGIVALLEAYAILRLYQDLKAATTKQAETAASALQAVQAAREESKEVQGLLRSLLDVVKQLPSKRS